MVPDLREGIKEVNIKIQFLFFPTKPPTSLRDCIEEVVRGQEIVNNASSCAGSRGAKVAINRKLLQDSRDVGNIKDEKTKI